MIPERKNMLQFNILKWTDDKITYLKRHGIVFKKDIPQLPDEFIYKEAPRALSTFTYRKDIPDEIRDKSLLVFFEYENRLWPRLLKIDSDICIAKEYGGIVGFDLSPCVGMLRPRQKHSIMINAIHACYCGINGIKILPNFRGGDLGTICIADFFPDDCPFMIGNLGCTNNGFKEYGEYQLDILLLKKTPKILFVYGSITKSEAGRLIKRNGFDIISFPDRRNRVRNNSKSYRYYMLDGKICKVRYADLTKGGVA